MSHKIHGIFACLGAMLALGAAEIKLDTPNKWVTATDFIPVASGISYEFLCDAQGGNGRLDVTIYQYDKNKRQIGPHCVNAVPGTMTKLVTPIVSGQKSVIVTDVKNWDFPKKGRILGLNAKEDFSNLPNSNLEYYISKVTPVDNGFKIDFDRAFAYNYPAGTSACLHQDGGHLGYGVMLPMRKPMIRVLKPVVNVGCPAETLWHGAAFVRVVLRTTGDKPVTVRECKVTALDSAEIARREQAAAAAARAEAMRMKPYGFEKVLTNTPEEITFLNHYFMYQNQKFYWSGVSAKVFDVSTDDFGQFEFDLKSRVAAYLRVSFALEKDGKKYDVSTSYQSLLPDGLYHRYIFTPQDQAQWKKGAKITGWTLRVIDYKENGYEMGVRNPEFVKVRNMIPSAAHLVPGKAVRLDLLRPVGEYKLSWQEGNCPGVTLRFYDHLMKEIPRSAVTLRRGAKEVAFSAPEPLIYATATVNGKAAGFPKLECTYYKLRYMPEIYWRGQWIWSRHIDKGPDYAYVWFERKFTLDKAPDYAVLGLMADDLSEIYLNGKKIGSTPRYSIPGRFDLTGKLKAGENTLTVRVYNLDTAAGLCTDLYMRYPDGKEEYLLTDKQWLCHENGNSKERPEKIDTPVVELGNPATTPPWISGIGFVYVGPRGRFTLKDSVNGKFTATLDRSVIRRFRTLKFERRTASGKVQNFLLPAELVKNADGTVTVTYPALRPTDEASKVYLADEFWEINGNKPLAELPAVATKKNDFTKAEFVNVGRRTMLKFRNRLYDPTFYMTYQWERMMPVTKVGMHNYLVGAPFEEIWTGLDTYYFDKLDQRLETLLTVDPEAVFMLDIRFYMPEWWLEAYPDDASAYFEQTRRNTYDDVQALGSKRWLTDSEAPMRAILNRVREKGFADRVWGINIGDSRGNEWFWGGATAGTDFYRKPAQPGYSPADYVTFREMLTKRYGSDEALAKAWNQPGVTIATAKMPDHKLRRTGAVGSLFDPLKNAQIMDWCRFRNYALGEAIVHFGTRLKALTNDNALVGCYYGYMRELSESAGRSQLITGHNGFMRCIKSGKIDFFRAPSRYTYRRPGMPCGIMQTYSSFALRGKVVYIENDERTAYGPSEGDAYDLYCGRGTTAFESVGQINREFGMFAATGTAQYWLDHPKGSLYEPALVSVIGNQLKVYSELPEVKNLTPVETAVVGDIESIYYSTDGMKGIFASAVPGLFQHINQLGVPFHDCVLDDLLDKGVMPKQKFYIMLPTLVLTKEQREALLKRFEAEKATVLWLYAAGSSYPDKGPAAENCGNFFGLKCKMDATVHGETLAGEPKFVSRFAHAPWFFPVSGFDRVIAKDDKGKAVVVSTKRNGATHIFSTLPDLPLAMLAQFCKEAGVFRYVETLDDPMWIGNDLVTLYATRSGERRINLPGNKGKLKPIAGPLKKTLKSGEAWNAIGGQSYTFQVIR